MADFSSYVQELVGRLFGVLFHHFAELPRMVFSLCEMATFRPLAKLGCGGGFSGRLRNWLADFLAAWSYGSTSTSDKYE